MELLSTFLEEHPEEFRYTIMVDDAEGFAKDGKECKIAVVDAAHPPRLKPVPWNGMERALTEIFFVVFLANSGL